MIKMINILIGIGLIIGVVMLARTLCGINTEHYMIGSEAPAFPYSSIDEIVAGYQHPKEHEWLTLFVFAAECPHCQKVVSTWNQIAGDGKHEWYGKILGLSISPGVETWGFIRKYDVQFPVALVGGEFMQGYHISGTPTTIIIHRGVIWSVVEGYPTDEDMSRLINIHQKGMIL